MLINTLPVLAILTLICGILTLISAIYRSKAYILTFGILTAALLYSWMGFSYEDIQNKKFMQWSTQLPTPWPLIIQECDQFSISQGQECMRMFLKSASPPKLRISQIHYIAKHFYMRMEDFTDFVDWK